MLLYKHQSWIHLFVDFVPILYESQVRVFYYNDVIENDGSLTTKVSERKLLLNEEVLSKVLRMPKEGIRLVVGKPCSKHFMEICRKMQNLNNIDVPKKFLKGGYQLIFEFVNKILLHHFERRIVTSATDLILMENLSKFEQINLSAIILEHMRKILIMKDGKHGLGYECFLTKVFQHFRFPLEAGTKVL